MNLFYNLLIPKSPAFLVQCSKYFRAMFGLRSHSNWEGLAHEAMCKVYQYHLSSRTRNTANVTMMKEIVNDMIVSVSKESEENSSNVALYPIGLLKWLYKRRALHSGQSLLSATF